MLIRRLVVIGVGLIGGSAALALRRAGQVGEVVGVGRSRENLELAYRRGIIDRAATDSAGATEVGDCPRIDFAEALDGADMILVATPVAQFAAIFAGIAPHLAPDAVVTDGGSTKQDVVAAARQGLGDRFPRFVPAHPIAGTEHSGAAAAFAELYEQRKVVIAPEPETDPDAGARVRAMWAATGATVVEMTAARHDAIFAAVSHLPHLLAFALVEELAERPDAPEFFAMAASGFRDFTRIAASSPEMWRDIALANRDALLDELRRFRAQVERVEALLAARDADGLTRLFQTAREARTAWEERR